MTRSTTRDQIQWTNNRGPVSIPAPQTGTEALTKRAQAERVYADLSATGAPVSAGALAAAAGLCASYARALVAQFQARPPAALQHNGRPSSASVMAESDRQTTP